MGNRTTDDGPQTTDFLISHYSLLTAQKKAIPSDGSIRLLVKIRRFSKATGFRVWFSSDQDVTGFLKDRMGFFGRTGLVCFSIGSGFGFFLGSGLVVFQLDLDWFAFQWDLDKIFRRIGRFFQGSGFVAALTETNV